MAWMLCEIVLTTLVELLTSQLAKKGWRFAVMNQCLIKGCYGKAACNCRGLCLKCYTSAKKKVDDGEVTWEKLVEVGLAAPERSPFDDAYSQVMEGQ